MLAFFLRMFYNYKAFENCICRSGGMADASDSKSDGSDTVWVQVPPSAPKKEQARACSFFWLLRILVGLEGGEICGSKLLAQKGKTTNKQDSQPND